MVNARKIRVRVIERRENKRSKWSHRAENGLINNSSFRQLVLSTSPASCSVYIVPFLAVYSFLFFSVCVALLSFFPCSIPLYFHPIVVSFLSCSVLLVVSGVSFLCSSIPPFRFVLICSLVVTEFSPTIFLDFCTRV